MVSVVSVSEHNRLILIERPSKSKETFEIDSNKRKEKILAKS